MRTVTTLLIILAAFTLTAHAGDFYVSTSGSDGNNGTTPGNAWRTLAHAVDNVTGTVGDPAVIHVAAGTYDRDGGEEFPITVGDVGYIQIVGAGVGSTILDGSGVPAWQDYYLFEVDGPSSFSLRDIHLQGYRGGIEVTGSTGDINFDNLLVDGIELSSSGAGDPAFYLHDFTGDVTVDSITVDGGDSEHNGGVFKIQEVTGDIHITNSTFTDNLAHWSDGGVVWVNDLSGSFTLSDCEFEDSQAEDHGGALYFNTVADSIAISSVTLVNSYAEYGDGGDFYFRSVSGDITLTEIDSDSAFAFHNGGSVYMYDNSGDLTIDGLDIFYCGANDANGNYDDGGAIAIKNHGHNSQEVALTLNNITVNQSEAKNSGGAIYLKNIGDPGNGTSALTLSGISVDDATARWDDGGAIAIQNVAGPVNLIDVTLENTYAHDKGGALYIKDIDGLLTLAEVTIENAYNEWNKGGGIYLEDANGAIEAVDVTINTARSYHEGGGLYIRDIEDYATFDGLFVENCETVYGEGGGVYLWTNPHVDSLHFNNMALCANVSGDEDGGGMYVYGNQNNVDLLLLTNFSVIENETGTYGEGGGLYVDKVDQVELRNGTISLNTSGSTHEWSEYDGGGMYAKRINSLKMNNVVFNQNTANGNGGGLLAYNIYDEMHLDSVVFYGNTAVKEGNWSAGEGGGLYFDWNNSNGPDYYIRNGLFAENTAQRNGGAIYMRKGQIDLVSCTVAWNSAGQDYPSFGMHNQGEIVACNTIVWGNNDDHDGSETTYRSNRTDFEYSDVEKQGGGTVNGPGNIKSDPLFAEPDSIDFTIQSGSPCIDTGTPYDGGDPWTDYSHEPDPNGGRINMGYWGGVTGAGCCYHCGGTGSWPGEPGGGGGTSQSKKIVLRDKYIFIGTPVMPYEDDQQENPDSAWGDDVNYTDPGFEDQTWRWSRYTNGTDSDEGNFVGYLRYREPDEIGHSGNYVDAGDPPDISPGLGYWFVWNYGAIPDGDPVPPFIYIDIHKYALPQEPYEVQLVGAQEEGGYGLNQMANPFSYAIDWSDVKFSDDQATWITLDEASEAPYNWVNRYAYTWNHANEYYEVRSGRIDKWEGFWVVTTSTDSVWMQFQPEASDESLDNNLDELDEVLDWSLTLTARRTDALQVDYYNWIGVGDEVEDGLDKYDAFEFAPVAKEAIFLRSRLLNEENNPTERLTFDFRSNNLGDVDYKAWLMEGWFYHDTSVPGAGPAYPVDVKLQWPTISSVPNDVTLRLYEFTGAPFSPNPDHLLVGDMREQDEYILNVDTPYQSKYYYTRFWVVATTEPGLLDVPVEDPNSLPTETALRHISPNPFNPVTTVRFDVAKATDVTLEVFNLLGQRVAVLADRTIEAGRHELTWNALPYSSGAYFIRFNAPQAGVHQTQKVILMK